MQSHIIRSIHDRGHISARKIEAIVRRKYSITKLNEKFAKVISNCVACVLASRKAGKQEGLYHPIDKSGGPLHTYHMDHLGPLPSTAKSYRYVFMVVDAFSKFVWLYPIKDTSCAAVLKKLETQQDMFGSPKRIISDTGAAFTSNDFRQHCENEKIEQVLIATGVPRGNGQAERINGIIVPALTKLSIQDPMKWYQYVNQLQRFLNSTVARSTGRTPFELMFGVPMRNAEDQLLGAAVEEAVREDFKTERENMRTAAKHEIEKLQIENRLNYNQRRKPARIYQAGDLVAIKNTQFVAGGKVQAKFIGPYKVVAAATNDRYEVERTGNGPGPGKTTTSADLMKPCVACSENDESTDEEDDQEVIQSDADNDDDSE